MFGLSSVELGRAVGEKNRLLFGVGSLGVPPGGIGRPLDVR